MGNQFTLSRCALNIENLNQGYGEQVVLHEVNLSINQGEYIGLVGRNGAGKTTLIKSILDFVAIQSGKIEIFGKPHNETQSRETVSFLPEKFLPPYYLTGQDFLAYMSRLNKVILKRSKVDQLFHILDLDLSVLKKPVRQYSKGMAQKLGLASCLLSEKPLLLFDEPMSGLDPKARIYLKQYLVDLKGTKQTLFFSTHLLTDVERICDRIIVLHQGQVFFSGSLEACYQKFAAKSLEEAYLKCINKPE